ncbi:hypothetical protein ACHAWF_003325 [Thalassiosira exigua]
MFKYVFIPANDSAPIEIREGDKSGGLENDVLSRTAKDHFFGASDKGARAAALDGATPEQRKVLADRLREEVKSNGSQFASQMAAMDDEVLIDIMKTTHTSSTCEITALTVPTASNQHRAVSMYSADDARTQNLPYNRRATELLVACGHNIASAPSSNTMSIGAAPPGGICGDAFVGRCHDNEAADIWERVDFTVEDANPRAEWCDVARRPGGGGAVGGGGPRSMSGLMQQNAAVSAAGHAGGEENAFGGGKGDGFTWSQNDEEVELRFPVSAGTKAKYVKVAFGRAKLKVALSGQTLISGNLGGTVDVDESTFTIEDANVGPGKELCVTLTKHEGNTWPFVIQNE